MTISRVEQLLAKGGSMKRLVSKKRRAVQHEAFELGLRYRDVRAAERDSSQMHPNPQQQLQHQQQVQMLLAIGMQTNQLELELHCLGQQQEVLDQQIVQLEAANKGVAPMKVEEEGWVYPGIPLDVEAEEIWQWVCSMVDNKSSRWRLLRYHKEYLECRDDRKAIWRFATKIQWHLGVGIVLPMTDLRS